MSERRRRPDEAPVADRSGDLHHALRDAVRGDVRFDAMSRVLYASDASSYQVEPLGVVLPRDADDVSAAVEVCAAHRAPVIPRGGGSGLAGQAIGAGVVIDCSMHMRNLAIDPDRAMAIAEPGVVLEELNARAAPYGLQFGPDPASSDRACVGGVVGTNATGARSIVHGMTVDHLRAADIVLSDGGRARLEPRARASASSASGTPGERRLYAGLVEVIEHHGDAIARDFPAYWRRSGGYHLDRLLAGLRDADTIRAPALLAGSEGTLATATRLELGLVPLPARRGLLVVHFDDPLGPFRAVPHLLGTKPTAIEHVGRRLLELAREAPGYRADVALVVGSPEALLVVEYSGDTASEVRAGLARAGRALARAGLGRDLLHATTVAQQAQVWRVRKAGLGLLMRMRGDWKPAAGIEDVAVPPEHLADYIGDVRALLARRGVEAAFYAHASAGCIHVRPILNLKTAAGVDTLMALSEETCRLALRYGGVNASEHGDGLARSALNRLQFGDDVLAAMRALKDVFDPLGLMNPGKVVDAPDPREDLRFGPDYVARGWRARFAYPNDGDLTRAVEQCNGAGVCRKLGDGAMCPSYMVTLDEEHSTRGRANALRAILDGRLDPDVLTSDRMADVMRLCVACKACETECPSGVDMARLKAEVLAERHAQQGTPVRSQLFGRVHDVERILSPVAPIANLLARSGLWSWGARWLSVEPRRRFPPLARRTFDHWWKQRSVDPTTSDARRARGDEVPERPVAALFVDTYATYQEPEIGRAAALVMEAAGYRVVVPQRTCCGRPALSQGLLDHAAAQMRANIVHLAPLARSGVPIVVPEPSCASALRDEMPDLLTQPDVAQDARRIADAVITFDEFVAQLPPGALRLSGGDREALVHVHCHQRAATGVSDSVAALGRVPGLDVREPDAGCCGMAGAFGYQVETYAFSIAMAERRLAPAVRSASESCAVIAAGASCRQQIADTTGRRAEHPAVFLARCLERAERT